MQNLPLKKQNALNLWKKRHNWIEATRKEDGCLSYQLYESTEQVNVFVMVENWRDEQAIEGHNQSPLLQQLFKNMPEYAEKETELNVAKTLA